MGSPQYQKQWRERNKSRLQEYRRQWYRENKARIAAAEKAWAAANPDAAEAKRKTKLETGLPEPTRLEPEFCEACGRLPERACLCLDHDHVTGEFRGWLCHSCNSALGLAGDTVAGVERLLVYLRRQRC